MTLHVYTAPGQPATRYIDRSIGTPMTFTNPPNRPLHASCCKRQRQARNLTVQVYYDCVRYSCVPGKGCKG